MSPRDVKKFPTLIHASTVATLSQTERFFVDLFVREGTYRIVTDEVTG